MSKIAPRYPIYVPSKDRFENCLTAKFMIADGVDFRLVVEPQQREEYVSRFGADRVLVLPFSNLGLGSIPARNWIWEHAKAAGAERHWTIDDNCYRIRRFYRGHRIPCAAGPALASVEDFTDRYENIGISGLNYQFFGVPGMPPFYLNQHVYSCMLIGNDLPFRWRGRYNEDTDLCLQVLSAGLCTVLVNVFLIHKVATMTMKGGNMTDLYQGDGRLTMARDLERAWPGVVTTTRKFKRSQHHVREQWRLFDTPLKRREDVDFSKLPATDEYGLSLRAIGDVDTPAMQKLIDER